MIWLWFCAAVGDNQRAGVPPRPSQCLCAPTRGGDHSCGAGRTSHGVESASTKPGAAFKASRQRVSLGTVPQQGPLTSRPLLKYKLGLQPLVLKTLALAGRAVQATAPASRGLARARSFGVLTWRGQAFSLPLPDA